MKELILQILGMFIILFGYTPLARQDFIVFFIVWCLGFYIFRLGITS